MSKGKQMKVLEDRLDIVRREMEKLKAQEALLLDMIRVEAGEPKVKPRAPRSNVKQAVLDLLAKFADTGLNAAMAVAEAKQDGVALDRGSVSSLLSRMKNEGVVSYENNVYRLVTQRKAAPTIVHPIRTSGGSVM